MSSCAHPVARFAATESVPAMRPVRFDNHSEKASSYEWDFGDGTQSTEREPTHRYASSGTYTVTLKAIDEKGRQKITRQTLTVARPDRCLVSIETPMGTMIAEIYDATPLHQDNFVKLVEQKFYDSLLFHRVIQGFMIQGGDPDSRHAAPGQQLGMGGPGYTIKAEFLDSLAHVKGALAAARTNNPQKRSSGSQFYIVQGKPVSEAELNQREGRYGFRYPSYVREEYLAKGGTPSLDQEYTVFGKVIEGLDVLDRIAAVKTNRANRPEEDVWMIIRLIR
ncbi:MAG: PKD domain-containing protein [Bacteroidetes bacterium]|nr:MAG: PKD domain-containing protein [Bacteroidota bacterium]